MTASITCRGCGMTSYHPSDVTTGYCGHCHRFTDDPTLTVYHRQAAVGALAAALRELDLPRIMPGEPVPHGGRDLLLEGDVVSLRRGTLFFTENGEAINLQPEAAFAQIRGYREGGSGLLNAELCSAHGVRVTVSTAYLGLDMGTRGPLPLPWETLVIVAHPAGPAGRGVPPPTVILEPVRYVTRAAAVAGHAQILAAGQRVLGDGTPTDVEAD